MVNRNIAILASNVITGALVFTLVPWIWKFYGTPISSDPADWGVFGDYIGGTLATFLAAGSFLGLMVSVIHQNQAMRKEWQLRDDESYNRQAIVCFERAFEKIKPRRNDTEPRRERQAWIDCARLLQAAEDLGGRIKSDGFKAVYESERAHWSGVFSDLFDTDNIIQSLNSAYFRQGPYGEELPPATVYVIYEFMSWQRDRPDTLDKARENLNIDRINKRYAGARTYLNNLPEFKENIPE